MPEGTQRKGTLRTSWRLDLVVDPHPRRGEIAPDAIRTAGAIEVGARRHGGYDRVGELDERRIRMHDRLGGLEEIETVIHRFGEKREARHRCGGGFLHDAGEGFLE